MTWPTHVKRNGNNRPVYKSIPSVTIPPPRPLPGAFDQIFCPGCKDLTRTRHLSQTSADKANANSVICDFHLFFIDKYMFVLQNCTYSFRDSPRWMRCWKWWKSLKFIPVSSQSTKIWIQGFQHHTFKLVLLLMYWTKLKKNFRQRRQ